MYDVCSLSPGFSLLTEVSFNYTLLKLNICIFVFITVTFYFHKGLYL